MSDAQPAWRHPDRSGVLESGVSPAGVARAVAASRAPTTQRAYRSDWAQWVAWCALEDEAVLPADPQVVARYLVDADRTGYTRTSERTGQTSYRRYAVATLRRWVAAIDAVHRVARDGDPAVRPPGESEVVRRTLSGVARRRARGDSAESPSAAARAITLPELRRMAGRIDLGTFPAGVAGRRDRALLLCGFAMAARASELVGLDVADVVWHAEDGLHVRLRHRKNDQHGRGTTQVLPRGEDVQTCPACALVWWLRLLAGVGPDPQAASRPRVMAAVLGDPVTLEAHVCGDAPPASWGLPPQTPVFVSVHRTGLPGGRAGAGVVREVVRRRRAAAGLEVEGYSAHSLRAGAVTWAARRGASTSEIQRLTGHRSAEMVEVYRRRENPLEGNAVTKLGL